ncbi:MAG TPA: hypothetical protein VIJ14_01350, partial [Rhabdochlamydiaceae bacterium]
MSAIDFSKLPMTRKDFEIHFTQKTKNTKWLGRLFEYSQRGDNESVKKPKTLVRPRIISEPFESFPYRWDVKKSKVKIETFKVIVEDHTQFDPEQTSYVISLPFHNPSVESIQHIVSSIEDQSFDQTKRASNASVQKRVAVVIGLNNCHSFNPEQNDKFKSQIRTLRKTTFASHVSLTIIPFFWGHVWMSKSNTELGFTLTSRHIHPIHSCYRIAN